MTACYDVELKPEALSSQLGEPLTLKRTAPLLKHVTANLQDPEEDPVCTPD